MKWSRVGTSAAILAATAALAWFAAPELAYAGHSGEANSGTPDNADHYIDRHDLTSAATTAVNHGISELNRSNMNATLNGSGDVDIYDAYYGTEGEWDGIGGKVNCEDWNFWHTHCDVYRLRFNLTYLAGDPASYWESAACHELGHTAGLGHRFESTNSNNNSCMREAFSSQRPDFDLHDLDAINEEIA